jgi:RNA polymerase sigma-70 factor (ECF subfamily)
VGFASWDEHELVRRCKEGSEAAYAELVRRHRQRLVNLAYRLTANRETAEDVVQEAFIAAFRAMERFEPKPSLTPWLNTITVRLAGKAASKRAAAPDASLDRLLDPSTRAGSATGLGPAAGSATSPGTSDGSAVAGLLASTDATADPHAAAEAAEVRREVAAALSRLPFKHRTAVVLRFVMGLDYAEAAQTMDVPLNTYKSHLLRGTRQLRELLGSRLTVGEGAAAEPSSAVANQVVPNQVVSSPAASSSAASSSAASSSAGPSSAASSSSVPSPAAPSSAAPSSAASSSGMPGLAESVAGLSGPGESVAARPRSALPISAEGKRDGPGALAALDEAPTAERDGRAVDPV